MSKVKNARYVFLSPVYMSIPFICLEISNFHVTISFSKKNTADVAINSLEKMFATHGLPYTVTSDNGPRFVAGSFQTFLRDSGIRNRKITPLWPQANGEIEGQNR